MKYQVKSYNANSGDYCCVDEKGDSYRIDLCIDGDFDFQSKDQENKTPLDRSKLLVGRNVNIDYLHPYLYIGVNVSLVV